MSKTRLLSSDQVQSSRDSNMIDADALITDSLELVSLPAVVMQAIELLNDPSTSASDIGDVIGNDPALTAKLLRIVNSSFYGFPSSIETVSRAITIVGTVELTDLILGASAIQTFQDIPNELVDTQQFWEHSVYCAVVAKLLAKQLHIPNAERCFIMGLLHDIGSLVLYIKEPELSKQSLENSNQQSIPLHDSERELMGIDHAEVGAALMNAWNLPESFAAVMSNHHQLSAAKHHPLETAIIHLADVIAGEAHVTGSGTQQPPPLDNEVWALTGLSEDSLPAIKAQADVLFTEACQAILPSNQAA